MTKRPAWGKKIKSNSDNTQSLLNVGKYISFKVFAITILNKSRIDRNSFLRNPDFGERRMKRMHQGWFGLFGSYIAESAKNHIF